jgi:hypothetical protein
MEHVARKEELATEYKVSGLSVMLQHPVTHHWLNGLTSNKSLNKTF